MESDEFGELKWLWLTRLRSARAANTVAAYQSAVKMLEQWCEQTGHKPGVDRELIEAWTADSLAAGLDPGTAELRCTALRSLSAYLAAQGATDGDLLRDLRAPKRIKKIVPKLGPGELAALIAACKGTTFAERRDREGPQGQGREAAGGPIRREDRRGARLVPARPQAAPEGRAARAVALP